jgi:hypothetical protein
VKQIFNQSPWHVLVHFEFLFLLQYNNNNNNNNNIIDHLLTTDRLLPFQKEHHIRNFAASLQGLSGPYAKLDTNRMTLVHFSTRLGFIGCLG